MGVIGWGQPYGALGEESQIHGARRAIFDGKVGESV